MNIHLLAVYVVAVSLAMIAPGPDMMFILATGARGGPRAGLLATLGVASSEVVQITAVAVGLSALFAAAPAAFTVLFGCAGRPTCCTWGSRRCAARGAAVRSPAPRLNPG